MRLSGLRGVLVWIGVLALIGQCVAATSGGAEVSFAKGQTQLQNGQLKEALRSFAQAAREDGTNQGYRQYYATVRQIIRMQDSLDKEKNPQKWEYNARALRAFYQGHLMFKESLLVDTKFHEMKKDAATATLLAETQLELNLIKEALQLMDGLAKEKVTPDLQLLRVIALTQGGQKEQATTVLDKVKLPTPAERHPNTSYRLAWAQMGVGRKDAAMDSLKVTFERTSPGVLGIAKNRVLNNREFKKLIGESGNDPQFVAVLKTSSKIKESECSGGASCATCRNAASCSSSASCSSAAAAPK